MNKIKGTVIAVTQHSGCLQIDVAGELPGSFAIDNVCVWAIRDVEGPDWIGRSVEYECGRLRFLDSAEAPPVVPAE